MNNFKKLKSELKKLKIDLDIKTLVKKEKYWNEIYEDKSNKVRYDIFFTATPLTGGDKEIINVIKNNGYEIVENRIVSKAYTSGKGFNHKITIEVSKEELE